MPINYGLRVDPNRFQHTTLPSTYSFQEKLCLASMQPAEFQIMFANESCEEKILHDYELYSLPNFLTYARSLKSYEKFIVLLYERIKNDKKFRKQTAHVSGFTSSFSLFGKEKSGFHDFVKKEAEEIVQSQHAQAVCLKIDNKEALRELIQKYNEQGCAAQQNSDHEHAQRYKKRVIALNETLKNSKKFDYSNSNKSIEAFTDQYKDAFDNRYGTFLDKQLHEELCDIRIKATDLEKSNLSNRYLQACKPLVDCITAQAKLEQNVEKAFSLSDFCYDVLSIVIKGTGAIIKGAAQGVKTTFDPAHWKEMAQGMVNFVLFVADESERLEHFDNTLFMQNKDLCFKVSKEIEDRSKAHAQAVQAAVQKLRAMSWDELLEEGSALGTTLLLDGVLCKAATLCASKVGQRLVNELATVLNLSAVQERMVEVASFGKIALEESPEVVKKVIGVVAHNPELVADYCDLKFLQGADGSAVVKEVVNATTRTTWASENIPVGALYKELATIAPEIVPKHNFKHLFLGEFNKKGKLVGFHHARSYPERIKEFLVPYDKYGCYFARYVFNGKEKCSTFFPDNWNRVHVLKKISEAYKNPIKFEENMMTGITSEGMKIKIYFIREKTGSLIINSAHPIMLGME